MFLPLLREKFGGFGGGGFADLLRGEFFCRRNYFPQVLHIFSPVLVFVHQTHASRRKHEEHDEQPPAAPPAQCTLKKKNEQRAGLQTQRAGEKKTPGQGRRDGAN